MKKEWDGFAVSKRDRTRSNAVTDDQRRNNEARRAIEANRERQELAKELGLTMEELRELEQ